MIFLLYIKHKYQLMFDSLYFCVYISVQPHELETRVKMVLPDVFRSTPRVKQASVSVLQVRNGFGMPTVI